MSTKDIYKEKKYRFSIIVPVYNMEMYLKECIECIIEQKNVDFREEIQIILIDDGSKDNSYEILKEYKYRYPQNIEIIRQDNRGVSSARNEGLVLAKGEWINFLDADDKWEINSFEEVKKFAKNNPEISIISLPIYFFEGKEEGHILNDKFEKNKIVNIIKDNNKLQMSISSTFVKKDIIGKEMFDERLKYAEDALLVNKLILKEKQYGIVKGAKYLYRYRNNQSSTVQNAYKDKEWFIENTDKFIGTLINESENLYGLVLPYIQAIIIYDTTWKLTIRSRAMNTMSNEEFVIYLKRVNQFMQKINFKTIINQKYISLRYKLLMIIIKLIKSEKVYLMITKLVWKTKNSL